MIDLSKALEVAGVPEAMRPAAMSGLQEAERRARGLLWHKFKVRLFTASKIAKLLPWEAQRLVAVDATMADCDIAPMQNITAQGDNGPWHSTPEGDRPDTDHWLNRDPASSEFLAAVEANYWCKGEHPRSRKSRKAWYRRNGGEFRAWRLGMPVAHGAVPTVWRGVSGRLSVEVHHSGDCWIVNTTRRIGPLLIKTRMGFEVDNVFAGPLSPQLWFPIPGYQLRAPVTWSVRPKWEPSK